MWGYLRQAGGSGDTLAIQTRGLFAITGAMAQRHVDCMLTDRIISQTSSTTYSVIVCDIHV